MQIRRGFYGSEESKITDKQKIYGIRKGCDFHVYTFLCGACIISESDYTGAENPACKRHHGETRETADYVR